jgi:hypothetical protein
MYRKKSSKRGVKEIGLAFIIGIFCMIGLIVMFHVQDNLSSKIKRNKNNILHSLFLKPEIVQNGKVIHPDTEKAIALQLQKGEVERQHAETVQSLNENIEKIERLKQLASRGDKRIPLVDFTRIPNRPQYIVEAMQRLWINMGGTYTYVPYSIIAYESNFNTFTYNPGTPSNPENSYGLLQYNIRVPSHAKAIGGVKNAHKLYEPVFNMQTQFPELIRYEKEGIAKGLRGADLACYVARYGQRPLWKDWIRQAIHKTHQEYMNAIIE